MTTAKDEPIALRISRALAERIISGALAAGSRLPQDAVAEEFDASHVPVREAFRRLEAQGLVVSEPRRGVRVAGFSPEEVREVAEMRAALEVLALRHAAPHLTPAILDRAEDATRPATGPAATSRPGRRPTGASTASFWPPAACRASCGRSTTSRPPAPASCSPAGVPNGRRRPIATTGRSSSPCGPATSMPPPPSSHGTSSGSGIGRGRTTRRGG